MAQDEPPSGPSSGAEPPGGVGPPPGPPTGGPPTDPQSDGRAPAAQPAWPDAGVALPAGSAATDPTGGPATTGAPAAPEGVPPATTPDGGWTPSGLTPTDGWAAGATARPGRRFGLLPRLIVPAIIVVVLVGGFLLRDRLTGNVAELKPGDCFDDPITAGQASTEVQDVQHRPCSEPHLFEVIDTFKFPSSGDAAFPGHEGFGPFVLETCSAAFSGYVGIADAQSSLTYLAYTPVESGWKNGDRDVTCLLGALDGSLLTGSMKNARR